MASADTPLQPCCHPFRCEAGPPQVRVALLHHTTAASTPLALDHKSFAIECPLALTSHALYAIRVPRLVIYAPRFLPTLGYPHAVALHFIRCDQLMEGLAPTGVRPCWAHIRRVLCEYAEPFESHPWAMQMAHSPPLAKKKLPCGSFLFFSGGDGEIRTHDTGISRMHP